MFNHYLKLNYTDINACGERCDDLMADLFKGYLAAANCEFVCYIKTNQVAYYYSEDITSENLMNLALNKFWILSGSYQCKSKSPEE